MATNSGSQRNASKDEGVKGAPSRRFRQQNNRPVVGNRTSREEAKGKMLSKDGGLSSDDDEDLDNGNTDIVLLKNSKLFKGFFESLDALSLRVVNEREWHCPACKGAVGSNDKYKGMRSLIDHAKNVRSKREKLHRKLGEVLEEELKRRSVARAIAQEVYGKWMGLQEAQANNDVVWPPMVIIQNTNYPPHDNQQQCFGMGNKELMEHFKDYKAIKAKQAYGPKGHRGMSVLIFEDSPVGYLEADRLQKHFLKEGKGRDDWNQRGGLTLPSGKRILYGYLATKEDMESFNKHFKGNTKVKYDMLTYKEKILEPVRKMNEDSQKLVWIENKVIEDRQRNENLEKTISEYAKRLELQEKEIKILMQRATEQYEECKKGMDYMERSYKQQIDQLMEDNTRKQQEIEKMQKGSMISQVNHFQQLESGFLNLSKDIKVVNDKPKVIGGTCNIQ